MLALGSSQGNPGAGWSSDERGMSDGLLEGRIAVVTGAGRGIGFGIAERLAGEGATVVIGEIVEERGRDAAAALSARGLSVQAVPLDVSEPSSCATMVQTVTGRHGRIDVLVNNAGLFRLHRSEEMPEEDWRIQIDVMLTGTFFCSQAVGRVMMEQGGGCIVNIGDWAATRPYLNSAPYLVSKGAIPTLTRCLAVELGTRNPRVRVNCVLPGPVLFPPDMPAAERAEARDPALPTALSAMPAIATIPESIARCMASLHGLEVSRPPVELEASPVSMLYRRVDRADGRAQWFRRVFIEVAREALAASGCSCGIAVAA